VSKTILQVVKVDPSLIEAIQLSFHDLPETDHADGKYRLRKYSRVLVNEEKGANEITDLNVKDFTQSSKYNKHQGGMSRNFVNVDRKVLDSAGMRELAKTFRHACEFDEMFTMDIHQMRVRCIGGATQLSPEGWHQDGYDCVAMIGINRCNIIGGEVSLSTSKMKPPFLTTVIDTGTMIIIDDSYLWHNGRSIQPIDDGEAAYMDVMVFTGKKTK
jgi:hypothetical protein